MSSYDKALIYMVGYAIVDGYWGLGTSQNDDLGNVLSDLDPHEWNDCLSADPAYQQEYFDFLKKNYGDKLKFDYEEAIEIIKGYFLSYRPLAKIKEYVMERLCDEEGMKIIFEETRGNETYRIHQKYLA